MTVFDQFSSLFSVGPTNHQLLTCLLVSYSIFLLVDIVIGYRFKGSIYLFDDAAFKLIDVITFVFSIIADAYRMRGSFDDRSVRLMCQVISPLISVLMLMSISIAATVDAVDSIIKKLLHDSMIDIEDNRGLIAANTGVGIVLISLFLLRGSNVFVEISYNEIGHVDRVFQFSDGDIEFGRLDDDLNFSLTDLNTTASEKANSKLTVIQMLFPSFIPSALSMNTEPLGSLSLQRSRVKNLTMVSTFIHVSLGLLRTLVNLVSTFFTDLTYSYEYANISALLVSLILVVPLCRDIFMEVKEINKNRNRRGRGIYSQVDLDDDDIINDDNVEF